MTKPGETCQHLCSQREEPAGPRTSVVGPMPMDAVPQPALACVCSLCDMVLGPVWHPLPEQHWKSSLSLTWGLPALAFLTFAGFSEGCYSVVINEIKRK